MIAAKQAEDRHKDGIVHLFVDNSNVLIEGQRYAETRRKGRARLGKYKDPNYQIDWGKFIYIVKQRDSRYLADIPILYGSRPPDEDSVWQRIRDDGFDVRLFDRNIRNKEKGVDVEMGMDIAERIIKVSAPQTIVVAAGDGDFIPPVARARAKGWTVEVWFWANAAAELKMAASKFCPLEAHFDFLRLCGGVV